MTQDTINKIFDSDLGSQCYELFSTEDDRVFIRISEAIKHSNDNSLDKDKIMTWFHED